MDEGLVSRILGWFRALGYLAEARDPHDRRRTLIKLAPRGLIDYRHLEDRAAGTAEFMLALLSRADRNRMISAMAEIENILARVRWDDIRPRGPTCPSSDRECG